MNLLAALVTVRNSALSDLDLATAEQTSQSHLQSLT